MNGDSDEYLIKSKDETLCLFGIGYINHLYKDQTWASLGPRKSAKVFTRKEAVDICKKAHTFKLVKK